MTQVREELMAQRRTDDERHAERMAEKQAEINQLKQEINLQKIAFEHEKRGVEFFACFLEEKRLWGVVYR